MERTGEGSFTYHRDYEVLTVRKGEQGVGALLVPSKYSSVERRSRIQIHIETSWKDTAGFFVAGRV